MFPANQAVSQDKKKSQKVIVSATVKAKKDTLVKGTKCPKKYKVTVHGGNIDEDEEDIEENDDSDDEENFHIMIPRSVRPEQLRVLREFSTGLENDSPDVEIYRDFFRQYDEAMDLLGDKVNSLGYAYHLESFEKTKEMRELDKKSFELTRAYHKAKTEQEKATIEADLQLTLSQLFDLREKRKADEIKRLEADLQLTQKKFQERQTNKQSIIKKRLDMLLEKSDGLEW
jgi:hypothetical protein